MSRCSVSEALNAFAYWLGYCEKATKTYAARREKAYFEKDKGAGNFTYPGHLCGIQGGAWCAMMVSCALYEACGGREGAKAVMYGLWPYARCDQLYDAAPGGRKGRRDAWDPKPGDVIVFGRSIREHTGMVYAVDGTYVYTYEGNSANMCRKRSYLRNSDYIWGYVRPDYAEGECPAIPGEQYGPVCYAGPGLHELSKGCAGPEVRAATGGRASSYAVSAAVQAANRYRSALSDRQQQLFDAAYRRYLDEYSQKLDRYRLLADRENTDYGRWSEDYDRLAARLALLREGDRTDYQRWADDFGRLTDAAALLRSEEDAAYGRWSDDYARLADTLTRLSAREDTDYSRWADEYALLADRLRTLSGLYDSDYDKWYDERSDAYSRLVSAISSVGYDPTDEELALAGMTRTEADKWLAYYNRIGYYSGGRSYSGRGRRSSKASSDEGTGRQNGGSAYFAYGPTQKNTPIATMPSNIVTNALPLVNKSGAYPATTAVKDPVTVSSKGLIQSTLNSGGVGDSYNTWLQSRLKPDNAAEKVRQKITRERM